MKFIMTLRARRTATVVLVLIAITFHQEIQASVYSLLGRSAQTLSSEEERLLREILPQANDFSIKGGDPPHYRAYRSDAEAGTRKLVGFAFLTTDVEPLERGYEGPIEMLVGLNTEGAITSLRVLEHHEPYGYFSIERPAFVTQFEGKSILERFRVGRDVDAVTRATITIRSASRVIRKSARQIARKFLVQEQDLK